MKLLFIAFTLCLSFALHAKVASNTSADPVLEAKMMLIAEELRCLVCQNETIAASNAELAIDLKNQIRIKLNQGQSQKQILDFMVQRYGDFVLYRPPLKTTTALLWLGPFTLLAMALLMLVRNVRLRRRSVLASALSDADAAKARALLAIPPQN
jgi:cytochrome c-type biogenesis protein CcmH